ncbi:metallophosphoesterase [Thalassotalea marina]|uniref:Calcineurin-like phosphoesterase domain-containing protein n=1 Tax=Thalassotalea marina TaxID=1673741 RepID=A0A919EL55_9GAMM|nr:metallophosphoesterase [Thalassotalea marina]GHF94255.1 hypothetical protein GCM10017161_23120 [Thalassotalea marina]
MFALLKTNLKHFFITFLLLFAALVSFGIYHGAEAHFNEIHLAYKLGGEGPHAFYQNDQLVVSYVEGDRDTGFKAKNQRYSLDETVNAKVYFPLEDTNFNIKINPTIEIPPAVYEDNQPILALSDIEGNFKAFRDFLINHQVIDTELNWTFGKGHLVLVGDFVDRGKSVTQVLWFIYKLEQAAKAQGGHVHYIIGNHEIKNLQANFYSASEKYLYIASVLGKTQSQLYGDNAFIGRWLMSKNAMERINGHLFVHGGLHPKLAEFNYSIEQVNQIIRQSYRKPYYTPSAQTNESFLISNNTGPAWYRGYFKEDLTQEQVESGLKAFGATAAVVGHTIQWNVNKQYQGKVLAIDVKHPADYETFFPPRSSEGLLIKNGQYFRLLESGDKKSL